VHTHRTPRRRDARFCAAIATLTLTLTITACGNDSVAPAGSSTDSDGTGGSAGVSATPITNLPPIPTGDPDDLKAKRLELAKEAKAAEKEHPNATTVCLKSDGTLATEILHEREAGAKDISKAEKERLCKMRSARHEIGPASDE
jgi:hypothetical protein